MNFLKKLSLLLMILVSVNVFAERSVKLCLTGKIVADLPSYGVSFTNAALLAREDAHLNNKQAIIKTYFFDNRPLEPLEVYKRMRKAHCSAIIGFSYLSDLLLVAKYQHDDTIPIFSPYSSTIHTKHLPKNIFMFRPTYYFMDEEMMAFLEKHFGKPNDVLLMSQVSRDSMKEDRDAYEKILKSEGINFSTFNFLENDGQLINHVDKFFQHKDYRFIFLLSGAVDSARIVNHLKNKNAIFIGTENFGSSAEQSFYIRIRDKKIKSYFVRNLSYMNKNPALQKFAKEYKKRFKTPPSLLSAYTYDAAKLVFKTFKDKSVVNTDSVLDADYSGITGISIKNKKYHRSIDYVILAVKPTGYKYAQ